MASSQISHYDAISRLAVEPAVVLPSMLQMDFGHLAEEVDRVEQAGAKILHLDVMDGHFVDNLTYGLPLVAAFRKYSRLPIDAHLMISNPGQYVQQYVEAGADCITIHQEAVADPRPILESIRAAGARPALAINPPTPVADIVPALDVCDMVLVMSVMPGFGGQAFDPVALDKLAELRELRGDELLLQIDGGVNEQTIRQCANAGATWFVAGSAIFKSDSYAQSISRLADAAAGK